MTRVDPGAAAQKWSSRLSGATTEITAGVNKVTQAPGQQAAAKADKWFQNVTAAKDKWKRNVASVSVDDWKQSMTNIGIPRIAQGAQAKQGKYTAFASSFYPHLDAGTAKVNAMPDTTFDQRIARMVAMATHNHSYKRPSA